MADPDRALDMLRGLREIGVSISVDDFGTGYSSLAYLKRLPVNELEIDRAFVRDLVADRDDQAIVRSTISLGHDLGLRVVAEGVEDQATWELLERFGCDLVPGVSREPSSPGGGPHDVASDLRVAPRRLTRGGVSSVVRGLSYAGSVL